jgi:HIV-1 Vpr-binding protein
MWPPDELDGDSDGDGDDDEAHSSGDPFYEAPPQRRSAHRRSPRASARPPPPGPDTSRYVRYSTGPAADAMEIISLQQASEAQLLHMDDVDFAVEDLIASLGLLGTLCSAKETVVPVLQTNAVEQLILLLSHPLTDVVARTLWVINTLLSHTKCAMAFLDRGGVNVALLRHSDAKTTSIAYGVSLVLAKLASPHALSYILTHAPAQAQTIIGIQHEHMAHHIADVQAAACQFFVMGLHFPLVVQHFDKIDGLQRLRDIFKALLARAEDAQDVRDAPLNNAALKMLSTYATVHLLIGARFLFRRHRRLGPLLIRPPEQCLPRDPRTFDQVLMCLTGPAAELLDAPTTPTALADADPAVCMLTAERAAFIQRLIDAGFHVELLHMFDLYGRLLRHDLVVQLLYVIKIMLVPPFARTPLMSASITSTNGSHKSLVILLLALLSDYQVAHRDSVNAAVKALECIEWAVAKESDACDDSNERACGLLRMHDGVRILLGLLKLPADADAPDVETVNFRLVTRVVNIFRAMSCIESARFLLDQLGLRAVLADNLRFYTTAIGDTLQRAQFVTCVHELLKMYEGPEAAAGPQSTNDAAAQAAQAAADGVLPPDTTVPAVPRTHHAPPALSHAPSSITSTVRVLPFRRRDSLLPNARSRVVVDPFATIERDAIVSRTRMDYKAESLLALIADHLGDAGLHTTAATLRREAKLAQPALAAAAPGGGGMSLDGIVRTFLRQQHAACEAPIAYVPRTDLAQPHCCPPAPPAVAEHHNVWSRMITRKASLPGYRAAARQQRNFSYSHHKQVFDIRGDDEGLIAQCAAFLDDGRTLIVGTTDGGVALFDIDAAGDTEQLIEQHTVFEEEAIYEITMNRDSSLMGLSTANGNVSVCKRHQLPSILRSVEDAKSVAFADDGEHMLSTDFDSQVQKAKLYDLETGDVVTAFQDITRSAENPRNVACLDRSSQLVLNDGVLWDARVGGDAPIFRFDKISESSFSVFHPNNMLVLVDQSIWDLRSQRVLTSCPPLRDALPQFAGPCGEIIYAWNEHPTAQQITVIDGTTFQPLNKLAIRQRITGFCVDPAGTHIAGICDTPNEDTVVKIFRVACEAREAGTGDLDYDAADDATVETGSQSSRVDESEEDSDDEDDMTPWRPPRRHGAHHLGGFGDFDGDDEEEEEDDDDEEEDDDEGALFGGGGGDADFEAAGDFESYLAQHHSPSERGAPPSAAAAAAPPLSPPGDRFAALQAIADAATASADGNAEEDDISVT